MSLILEALKKSERQRRLGKVPTLATPTAPLRRRRRLPLLIVLLVLLAAVAWWVLRDMSLPLPWPATTSQEQTPATVPLDDDADRNDDAVVEMETPIVTQPPPPAAPPQTQPEAATPQPVQPPVAPQPVQDAAPAPAETPPTPAPAPPPPTAAAPQPTTPAPAPAPAVQLIWELPYSVRRDLPEVHLTMHVYADHPADRMAIINGERRGEGDEVAEGLILREIRSDGLLLEFRGQTFVYPRGGR